MDDSQKWSRLVGATVEIRKDGQLVRTGVVEHAMPDSSAIWLAADANNRRAMFASAENFEVWIQPRQLSSPVKFS
ncbi:hypothetical protein ACIQC5_10550 [Paenarthrobacter sp. NPDC092416]|uniref:hypothetical protein n=1 Tax=Paenarthrobacter sp. NPDC092416 TaxID=3364386 RepID=UPI00382F57C7